VGVAEHYDVQEMEFRQIYHWCPESAVIECKCGKRLTLKRAYLIEAERDCEGGLNHTASIREEVVIQLLDEEYEAHHHPGCY
jgi:hypothetical protein